MLDHALRLDLGDLPEQLRYYLWNEAILLAPPTVRPCVQSTNRWKGCNNGALGTGAKCRAARGAGPQRQRYSPRQGGRGRLGVTEHGNYGATNRAGQLRYANHCRNNTATRYKSNTAAIAVSNDKVASTDGSHHDSVQV